MKGIIPTIGLFAKKHSSTIIASISIIGVVATGISAIHDTPKALRLIDDANEKNDKPMTKLQMAKTAAPAYMPTIITGSLTIASIVVSCVVNEKRQASLSAACSLVTESFNEYRSKLIDIYGSDADKEVRDAVAREHCNYHAIDFDHPDKKILFYEPISHQTFRAYERTVMDAEYHLNRNYVLGGFISVNEYLDFLGLKEIPDGDNAGWSIDSGAYWLDFEHTKMKRTHNGEPMYAINCIFEPDEDWLCGWQ